MRWHGLPTRSQMCIYGPNTFVHAPWSGRFRLRPEQLLQQKPCRKVQRMRAKRLSQPAALHVVAPDKTLYFGGRRPFINSVNLKGWQMFFVEESLQGLKCGARIASATSPIHRQGIWSLDHRSIQIPEIFDVRPSAGQEARLDRSDFGPENEESSNNSGGHTALKR